MKTETPAVPAEWTRAKNRGRFVTYPEAFAAVLHAPRALKRSPDAASGGEVTNLGWFN